MYRKILVPLDGSQLAECALPHALTLARENRNTEIVLFRVCEPPVILADFPASLKEEWEEHVKKQNEEIQQQCSVYLREIARRLEDEALIVTTFTATGKAAEEILDYVANNHVDMIVMSTHGRSGISRWAYGSVADKVLRSSPVPVMIIRPQECGTVGIWESTRAHPHF